MYNAGLAESSTEAEEHDSSNKEKKTSASDSGKDKPLPAVKKEDPMEVEEMHAVEHFDEAQMSDVVVLVYIILHSSSTVSRNTP